MTAAMGLDPIMRDSDIDKTRLADGRVIGKCPFGHVGIPLPIAKLRRGLMDAEIPRRSSASLVEFPAMTFFLVMLIGGFAIAVVIALLRGRVAIFRDAEHIRQTGHAPQ